MAPPDPVRGEHVLERVATVPRSLEETFAFFADAENLERITPPELRFRIVTPRPVRLRAGALIDYRLRLFGVPFGWRTEIARWEPPAEGWAAFVDRQLRGPYRLWHHTHTFRAVTPGQTGAVGDATRMTDRVRWALPAWPLGEAARPVVRAQLKRIFDYRAERIGELLGRA